MYNDVDMVWLADPFPYLVGNHDVYFTDDMTPVSNTSAIDRVVLNTVFISHHEYQLKHILNA